MILGDIDLTSGITALVVSLIGLFIQTLITHSIRVEFERKLETHKAHIKRENDIQLEAFKAGLAEQHFRFSHVFERTATTIETIFKNLLELGQAVQDYSKNEELEKEDKVFDKFLEKNNQFYEHYYRNRIYIPKSTTKQIETFAASIHERLKKHAILILRKDSFPEKTADIKKIRDYLLGLDKKITELLDILETDFRNIFGISDVNRPIAKTTDGNE